MATRRAGNACIVFHAERRSGTGDSIRKQRLDEPTHAAYKHELVLLAQAAAKIYAACPGMRYERAAAMPAMPGIGMVHYSEEAFRLKSKNVVHPRARTCEILRRARKITEMSPARETLKGNLSPKSSNMLETIGGGELHCSLWKHIEAHYEANRNARRRPRIHHQASYLA